MIFDIVVVIVRETTWTKPLELSDPEERKAREAAQANLLEFFHDMENNMRNKIKQGFNSAEVVSLASKPTGGASDNEPRSFASDVLIDVPTRVVRTISTVDDLVLEQAKRSDSHGSSPASLLRKNSSKEFYFDIDNPNGASSPTTSSVSATQTVTSTFEKMSRRNSSSTIYVDSTMSNPDKEATIKCVCTVIRAHMLEAVKDFDPTKEHPKAKIFHDYEFKNTGSNFNNSATVPRLTELILFFRDLYTKSQVIEYVFFYSNCLYLILDLLGRWKWSASLCR